MYEITVSPVTVCVSAFAGTAIAAVPIKNTVAMNTNSLGIFFPNIFTDFIFHLL
jgi:hypothetical protein